MEETRKFHLQEEIRDAGERIVSSRAVGLRNNALDRRNKEPVRRAIIKAPQPDGRRSFYAFVRGYLYQGTSRPTAIIMPAQNITMVV
jgi:hypothetical protein